jgi:hypothetical protein
MFDAHETYLRLAHKHPDATAVSLKAQDASLLSLKGHRSVVDRRH